MCAKREYGFYRILAKGDYKISVSELIYSPVAMDMVLYKRLKELEDQGRGGETVIHVWRNKLGFSNILENLPDPEPEPLSTMESLYWVLYSVLPY